VSRVLNGRAPAGVSAPSSRCSTPGDDAPLLFEVVAVPQQSLDRNGERSVDDDSDLSVHTSVGRRLPTLRRPSSPGRSRASDRLVVFVTRFVWSMSSGPLDAVGDVGGPVREGADAPKQASFFIGARARTMLLNPNRVVTIFWAGGLVAVVAVLPLGHWPRHSFLALVVIAGACAAAAVIRFAAGMRLPHWTLHIDVGVATVVASVLTAVGLSDHVDFADLYVWVGLFAALYFRPFAVLAYVGGIGAAYAVTLALGPEDANPVAAWLAVFGTVAVATAVLFGVVSVLRSAAHTDPLTGLANRRSWDERFDEELERSRRTGQGLSVAMIDLDGFKTVNDRDGHEAGDRVLEELASAWQAVLRSGGDFLARLGGDEFGLLAPGSDATGIRRLIKRLGEVLPAGVVASIGVVTWDGTENASDLLRRADQAMYETKLRHRREGGRHPA